jgi:hypothetical protein
MGYLAQFIKTSITGNAHGISAARDLDGRLWAVYYDSAASPKRAVLYYNDSNGNGLWTAESWSGDLGDPAAASDGGASPHLVVDPSNNLWCCMRTFAGSSSPVAIKRIESKQRWGAPFATSGQLGEYRQFTTETPTDLCFCGDSATLRAGVYNICCAFIDSGGDVVFSDLSTTDEEIDGTGTNSSVRIKASSGGRKHVAWVESSKVYYSWKDGTGDTWSARAQISGGGQTCQTVEDIVIQPGSELPSVLYRINSGSPYYLYFTELGSSGTWTTPERIWDGSNNYSFYTGCSLSYDERGSIWAATEYDNGGLGRAEATIFKKLLALDASTSWAKEALTASSGGDVLDTFTLCDLNPSVNGYKPNQLYQGFVFWTYVWGIGLPVTAQAFFFVDNDSLIGNPPTRSTYPTMFSEPGGEKMYYSEPDYEGSTITLTGEYSSGTTFPLSEAITSVSDRHEFQTSMATFDAGWTATVARFPSGRRILSVETVPLTGTQKDTLQDFLEARQADGAGSFEFTIPGDGAATDVSVISDTVSVEKVGVDVWTLRWEMEEKL